MFGRKKKAKGHKKIPGEKLRPRVNYFIDGEKVVFRLNGLDFTFESFYLAYSDEWMRIFILEEAPMNLIMISDVAHEEVEVDREEVINADTVSFTLQLKDEDFVNVIDRLREVTEPHEAFDVGGDRLKDPSKYNIRRWGMKQVLYDE